MLLTPFCQWCWRQRVRRADRLFDIIQALRGKSQPTTAAMLAKMLEVTTRTIYRDIATLQARRISSRASRGLATCSERGLISHP